MNKFIASLLVSLGAIMMAGSVMASEGAKLESANVDIHNKASLQRGAKYFVNYCMGCHSLNFSRYNRLAEDLGLTDEQVQENLIFTRTQAVDGTVGDTKVGEQMKNGMRPEHVTEAFGSAPPDLSLVARSRGSDWIYNYLKAFYLDPARTMGVNNTVLPNAGMPHVLWELQGWQELEKECTTIEGSEEEHCATNLVLTEPGKMGAPEYSQVVRDITNFLTYVGEPAQLHRKTYGVFVLLFLLAFAVLAFFLKKEFWRDVH